MGGGCSTQIAGPRPKQTREVRVFPTDEAHVQTDCRSGVLLDCGSGHTSVLWYSKSSENSSQIRQLRRSKLKLPRGGNLKVG